MSKIEMYRDFFVCIKNIEHAIQWCGSYQQALNAGMIDEYTIHLFMQRISTYFPELYPECKMQLETVTQKTYMMHEIEAIRRTTRKNILMARLDELFSAIHIEITMGDDESYTRHEENIYECYDALCADGFVDVATRYKKKFSVYKKNTRYFT